jgi:hypothetical protein
VSPVALIFTVLIIPNVIPLYEPNIATMGCFVLANKIIVLFLKVRDDNELQTTKPTVD